MLNAPRSLVEAQKYRYRQWAGNPGGSSYRERDCAYEVPDGGRSDLFHQCFNRKGYGPAGLYCKAHAKKVEILRSAWDAAVKES